ncbi:MAG: N-carbamoylputrescine amidase [Longimicrobiales bacterium]|jgi:N-carbamoylputrescine amidase|nr:acyltransferase [Dehalococcoidia bacterium]MDE0730472.1 N-carbamoylputrescine amidase [Longimicrobiales bacterium]|tara:strand:+ start:4799 stop:5629 length:831 start_codon:yes stop_codon:yes gene_type:complete
MTETVRCALIQTTGITPRDEMMAQQTILIRNAAAQGAQIIGLQELATGPYFCQNESDEWFDLAESVPDGPTTAEMMALAAEIEVALVVPLFEEDDNFFYNTAVVIDADGTFLGRYRKTHIPYAKTYREKYYFKPGNTGFPVFSTRFAKIGVYICYDRHFPEGARALGKNGAEIVFIPSATGGRSKQYWHIEQRGHAIANGYFVATSNRVGKESTGPNEFYGHSYFCDPYGRILSEAGEEEEVLIADIDLSSLRATHVDMPFWRDRRPETYDDLTAK